MQIIVWVIIPKAFGMTYAATFTKNLLRVIILIQYIPRMSRFTPLLAGNSPTGFIFETAQANFFINLFLFLLVAHVVGSCWYLFGLQVCYKYFPFLNFVNSLLGLWHLQYFYMLSQRVNECLHNVCKTEKSSCIESYLDCGDGTHIEFGHNRSSWINATNASYNCFTSPTFDYGIYVNAVPITKNPSLASKYFYSLFWGFLVSFFLSLPFFVQCL